METVCTAGITEEGRWIRIYPVPFRMLENEHQYKKHQWMSLPLVRNAKDFRPESHRVLCTDDIVLGKEIKDWHERRQLIFHENSPVFTNVDELIAQAKDEQINLSLASFKPQEILEFVIEKTAPDWPQVKLDKLEAKSRQQTLFQTPEDIRKELNVVEKVPYHFSYRLTDVTGKERTLKIIDWEVGVLYWNCLRATNGNQEKAVQQVRQKYFDWIVKERDVYLFLGTTFEWHKRAPNPFTIIGVFYPPYQPQQRLF
ncbi:MAG: hypothetical protein FWH27_02890 [Planctomycetaceae bacterium]|nr:hypothetical protein [Planctomycetaceae bacterium]